MDYFNGKTKPLAIIGNPLGHSLSPYMQNIFLRESKLNMVYLPFEFEESALEKALNSLWLLGFLGANVTIPYKESCIPFLKTLSPEAELIGAVNTLVRQDGGFKGDNTDGKGFLNSLKKSLEWCPRGKRVLILGAGGASRAVAVSLALEGAESIMIVNRNPAKAIHIVELIKKNIATNCNFIAWDSSLLRNIAGEADIIINTTPLGMEPKIDIMPPLPMEVLLPGQLVVDLIYNPLETRFLQEAKRRGCRIENGLGMLIEQGVLSFQLWTGKIPQALDIRKKMENFLRGDV